MDFKRSLILSALALTAQGEFKTWTPKSIDAQNARVSDFDQNKALCLIAGAAILGIATYFYHQRPIVGTQTEVIPPSPSPIVLASKQFPDHSLGQTVKNNEPLLRKVSSLPKLLAAGKPALCQSATDPEVITPIPSPIVLASKQFPDHSLGQTVKNNETLLRKVSSLPKLLAAEKLAFCQPAIHRTLFDRLKQIKNDSLPSEGLSWLAAFPFHNQHYRLRSNLSELPIFPVLLTCNKAPGLNSLYSFSGSTEIRSYKREDWETEDSRYYPGLSYLGTAPQIASFFDQKMRELVVFYSKFKEKSHLVDRIESYSVNKNNSFHRTRLLYINNSQFPALEDIEKIEVVDDSLFMATSSGNLQITNFKKLGDSSHNKWLVE